jgi:putative transposase
VKKKRFSVEQITSVLQQVASGVPVGDDCRKVGISEQTFCRWKKAYGGMLPSEARELKQLRDENTTLKRLVADLSLDKVMLQDIVQKAVLKPVKQREVMHYLIGRYGVSERRACLTTRLWRSSLRYESQRDPLTGLRQRMRELAQTRVRFGYRRLLVMLHREGWQVGKRRFYHVYTDEGLALRRKRPWRHATAVHREQRRMATARNDIWSMDFVADQLAEGRRFRALTVVGAWRSTSATASVAVMSSRRSSASASTVASRSASTATTTEFVSAAMDLWAYSNGVILDFSRRVKPNGQRRNRIVQRTISAKNA